MKINEKHVKIMRWTARVAAVAVLLLGLPFYFGYGNPLPFANPDNSMFDNIWLSVFPLMFIGLALGWKYPKIGGYLVVVPIVLASIFSSIFSGEIGIPGPMFVPLIIGALYLVVGYKEN